MGLSGMVGIPWSRKAHGGRAMYIFENRFLSAVAALLITLVVKTAVSDFIDGHKTKSVLLILSTPSHQVPATLGSEPGNGGAVETIVNGGRFRRAPDRADDSRRADPGRAGCGAGMDTLLGVQENAPPGAR